MKDYRHLFSPFDGKIWLNAASEGPLPLKAQETLKEALAWKSKPYLLDNLKFTTVVQGLKSSIAQLIGVENTDVILSNSASYGLHLLANGIHWKKGDEIVCMQNDFPTNILPWLALEKDGVKVKQVKARGKVLTPDELLENVTRDTRLFCISHVHTFSGFMVDVENFAKVCRDKKIIFVLNISQSSGTMPVDISKINVDAVVCAGYKWLCGPYGAGFCWIKPELRRALNFNQAYWVPYLSQEELKEEGPLKLKTWDSSRKYDVFGTANFFNFVPFKSCIDLWLEIGLDTVREYHQKLLDEFIKGLDKDKYFLISPPQGKARSSLIVFSHKKKEKNGLLFKKLKEENVYTALWKGHIRVAPHIYNTQEEIQITLRNINQYK